MDSTPSSQGARMGTPTPEAELNPSKVKVLLQKLKDEMALAKASTNPEEQKKHYEIVEKIKRILFKYQKQHEARSQNNGSQSNTDEKTVSTTATPIGTPTPTPSQLQNQTSVNEPESSQEPQPVSSSSSQPPSQPSSSQPVAPTVTPAVQVQPQSQSQPAPAPAPTQPQKSAIQAPAPQRPNTATQQQVTVEKYKNVRATLQGLLDKLKDLEGVKNDPSTTETRKKEIESQIGEIRNQMQKYHTAALYMRNKLVELGRLSANSTPVSQEKSSSGATTSPASNLIKAEDIKPNTKPQTLSVSASKAKKTTSPTANLSSVSTPGATTSATTTTATHAKTPSISKVASTTKLNRPPITPSTTTITKAAVDPNVTPANIPDNEGRVLTKRKLTELINNIAIDQGDVKIPIDNDVEDIFLDLADDFVRSVVEFSGRLAKHRKLDKIDIRDVQLNLERNWGLRIPGYATDEIKAARKWQPNPEYIEKTKEISKANRD